MKASTSTTRTTRPTASTRKSRAKPEDANDATVVAGVRITNADRPIDEADGVTKLDVVRYHEVVAQWLVPQVCCRPLAVIKCPGGDFAHCFFQKHASDPKR